MGNKIDFNKKWFLPQIVLVRAVSRTLMLHKLKGASTSLSMTTPSLSLTTTERLIVI